MSEVRKCRHPSCTRPAAFLSAQCQPCLDKQKRANQRHHGKKVKRTMSMASYRSRTQVAPTSK